eukprot:6873669-Alexandrium_andersonii.AAC.1
MESQRPEIDAVKSQRRSPAPLGEAMLAVATLLKPSPSATVPKRLVRKVKESRWVLRGVHIDKR